VQQTERGPLDRTTAKAIAEIDGTPEPAVGKALVTDHPSRWPQAMGTDQEFTGPRLVGPAFEPKPKDADAWALPKPGTLLRNGATVIDSSRTDVDEALVIAMTNGMAGHPFVTWRLDLKTGNTYVGDYCFTLTEAQHSIHARQYHPGL
jgi:hypothetical protein